MDTPHLERPLLVGPLLVGDDRGDDEEHRREVDVRVLQFVEDRRPVVDGARDHLRDGHLDDLRRRLLERFHSLVRTDVEVLDDDADALPAQLAGVVLDELDLRLLEVDEVQRSGPEEVLELLVLLFRVPLDGADLAADEPCR